MRQVSVGVYFGLAAVIGAVALAQPLLPPKQVTGGAAAAPVAAAFAVGKGDYGVTTTDITIHDAVRNKELELRVRVPTAAPGKAPAEGWPLVVFSHGMGGSRDAFPGLLDLLASHGYASIAPTHADSIALQRRAGKGPGLKAATQEGRNDMRSQVDLAGRVADCTLILDQAAAISQAVVKAGGTAFIVDPAKVAIAGHSAGAFTTQLCAGVKVRSLAVGRRGLGSSDLGDARFKAAVIISGQGTSSRSLSDNSWAGVKVPLFVMTGSLDVANVGQETPETRQHPYTKSRGTAAGGPPAYLMFIEGATHSSYQGKDSPLKEKPTTSAALIGAATNTGVLTFLDAHLGGNAKALETLQGTKLTATIPGKVRYEHK